MTNEIQAQTDGTASIPSPETSSTPVAPTDEHALPPRRRHILGLAPRERALGYAVLADRELADFGVVRLHSVDLGERRQAAHLALADLIARHRPDLLAVEPPEIAFSAAARSIMALVQGLGAARGIPMVDIAPTSVQAFLALTDARLWRRAEGQKLATYYPQLARYVTDADHSPPRPRPVVAGTSEKYWWPLFSAVGVALTAHYQKLYDNPSRH